jgi:hypothetical protein
MYTNISGSMSRISSPTKAIGKRYAVKDNEYFSGLSVIICLFFSRFCNIPIFQRYRWRNNALYDWTASVQGNNVHTVFEAIIFIAIFSYDLHAQPDIFRNGICVIVADLPER